jgi:hypothetical protein
MRPRNLRRITFFDVLLIAAVLVSAAVSLVSFWRGAGGEKSAYVYQDGRLVQVLPLDRDRVVEVPGEEVSIEVSDNRIRIRESSCPKRICVQVGWVSRPGRPIVCVPKKLMIQVKGERPEYDAETY